VTGYVITPYKAGVAQTPVAFESKAKSETVTGLTNGASYTFAVAASAGTAVGPLSAQSAAVVIGAPAAPDAPKAKVKKGVLTVSWKAPANGGSAITGYVLTPYKSGVAQTPIVLTTPATSDTPTGLTSGSSYTFTVAAVNGATTGPVSPASNAVTAP
jgi:hypothetical protein